MLKEIGITAGFNFGNADDGTPANLLFKAIPDCWQLCEKYLDLVNLRNLT